MLMNEECSAILNPREKLPEMLKDPWSFTIPHNLGELIVSRASADLGARINIMPYDFFKILGVGEPKLTRMSIQLADSSGKYPRVSLRMCMFR